MPIAAKLASYVPSEALPKRAVNGALPAAWRLAPAVLAAAALTRYAPWTLTPFAALGLMALFALLARHGSGLHAEPVADAWGPPGRRFGLAGFLAGGAAFANFLLLALAPMLGEIDDPLRRQMATALLATALLLAVALAMGAQGWRWRHALLLGGGALLALAALTVCAAEPPARGDWGTGFVRLAFVFLLAEILVPGRGPRLDVLGITQAVLAWLMLALAQRLPADVGPGAMLEPWAWLAIMGLLAAFLAGNLWRARRALVHDLHWALRGHQRRPMPAGFAATLGFIPAAALAPLAGWNLWTVSFGLACASALACRWAWRGRLPVRTVA